MNESNGTALGKFFGILLRLLVVVVLGIVFAAAIYFGAPRAYRGLVEPAQVNTTRLDVLEDELGFAREDTSSLRDQTGDRLAELEAALAEQAESLATAQTQLESSIVASMEQSDAMEALTDQIGTIRGALGDVSKQLDAALEDVGQPEDQLRQELLINRAMLHLVRARLGLLENNAGLAADEAGRARALLVETDPEGQVKRVQDAIARIDLALEAMQTTPLVAGDDLEIAWKLLIEGEASDE
jgi:chromosome segregation ATPase